MDKLGKDSRRKGFWWTLGLRESSKRDWSSNKPLKSGNTQDGREESSWRSGRALGLASEKRDLVVSLWPLGKFILCYLPVPSSALSLGILTPDSFQLVSLILLKGPTSKYLARPNP